MSLYNKLFQRDEVGAFSPYTQHYREMFCALLREVARGKLTGAEAVDAYERTTSQDLDAQDTQDASALLASINAQPSLVAKIARAQEIEDVFALAARFTPGYDTEALVRQRLA